MLVIFRKFNGILNKNKILNFDGWDLAILFKKNQTIKAYLYKIS